MRCVCSVCRTVYARKPCGKAQAGRTTHGLCPVHKAEAITRVAEMGDADIAALKQRQVARDVTADSFAPLPRRAKPVCRKVVRS